MRVRGLGVRCGPSHMVNLSEAMAQTRSNRIMRATKEGGWRSVEDAHM